MQNWMGKIRVRYLQDRGFYRVTTVSFGLVDYRYGHPRMVPDTRGRIGEHTLLIGPYLSIDAAVNMIRFFPRLELVRK